MGFQMSCDRCGRFMKNVPAKALRNMRDEEIVCPVCQKIESATKKRVDRLLKEAQSDLNRTAAAYKELVTDAVRESVDEVTSE